MSFSFILLAALTVDSVTGTAIPLSSASQWFTESLFRFDSNMRSYMAALGGSEGYLYTFPSVQTLIRTSERGTTQISKPTLEKLTGLLIDDSIRFADMVRPTERLHILTVVVSVLADDGLDTSLEPKLLNAINALSSLRTAGYAGLYYRSQPDSDYEDEVGDGGKSPKVHNLPWIKLEEHLMSVRDLPHEAPKPILYALIHASVKAAFGERELAERLTKLTESLIEIGHTADFHRVLSALDMDLLHKASIWTPPILSEDFAARFDSMENRIRTLIALVILRESLGDISFGSFPRPLIGASMSSEAFRRNLFSLPTETLDQYLELVHSVREDHGSLDTNIQFLALQAVIERSIVSSWSITDRIQRIITSQPLPIGAGILSRLNGQDREYAGAVANLLICIEIAGSDRDASQLSHALHQLLLLENDTSNKKYLEYGLIPAVSAVEVFLNSL